MPANPYTPPDHRSVAEAMPAKRHPNACPVCGLTLRWHDKLNGICRCRRCSERIGFRPRILVALLAVASSLIPWALLWYGFLLPPVTFVHVVLAVFPLVFGPSITWYAGAIFGKPALLGRWWWACDDVVAAKQAEWRKASDSKAMDLGHISRRSNV